MKIFKALKRAYHTVAMEHEFIATTALLVLGIIGFLAIFIIKPLSIIIFLVSLVAVIYIILYFFYLIGSELFKNMRNK